MAHSAETRAKMSASAKGRVPSAATRAAQIAAITKHGHASHERGTPTYYTWQQAKGRCYNPNNISYAYYGGRGITVCDEWREDFRNFLRDMGEKPSGTSIDRINNDGPYAPGNCRWATPAEQNANKRQMLWTVEQRAAQAARMRVVGLANRRVA